ncbi:MAG: hypothetical protein HZB85_03035 [Deltaproteobacteria bacterium]|nr:hypothetical protein [Deltaproteobacteria bacterium]
MIDHDKRGGRLTFYAVLLVFAAMFAGLYHGLLAGSEIYTHDSFIWLGSFYYFIDSLVRGSYPLWDPYSLAGTDFYPTIHTHGLLDPLVFASVFMVKALGASILQSYVYFYLFRLIVYAFGAYYLFKHISGSRLSALAAACVLVLAVAPTAFRQMGILENAFLTPFALYFLLKVFDHSGGRKAYVHLGLFSIAAGVSLNVFIPAYFSFNLSVFIIAIFALGIVRFSALKRLAADKLFVGYAAILLSLLVFMAAPTLQLFRESRSPDGEHFPSVRIVQKNDGMFKKMVASDVADDVLSTKFTDSKGVYGSAGNIVSFIFPDVFLYYFHVTGGFKRAEPRWADFISEAFQYIGIVAFLVAVIGFIWSKSRYRHLAGIMLVFISVNLFSYYGVHSRPPNAAQILFNRIFPLLGMMEVRETLSGFFLIYVCMLLALGLAVVFDRARLRLLVDKHVGGIIAVCLSVVLVKVIIALYLFKSAVYISTVDIISLAAIAGFCGLIYLYRIHVVSHAAVCVIIVGVIAADLYYYNRTLKPFVLQPNLLGSELANLDAPGEGEFDYYRIPFINFEGRLPLAFSEAVFRRKGAMSRANNHHFMTTKRFYDYFTNVPLANQAAASGFITPIVRFYPASMSTQAPARSAALAYLENETEETVSNRLVIETGGAAQPMHKPVAFELASLESEPWLKPENVLSFFDGYYKEKKAQAGAFRDPAQYLTTPDCVIKVTGFSPNGMEASVHTSVAGYLYYSDGWSRSWKAFDNGSETRIFPANYNFKAVALNPGNHVVHFVFDPVGYRRALYLYYFGLVGTSGLVCWFAVRRKGRKADHSP